MRVEYLTYGYILVGQTYEKGSDIMRLNEEQEDACVEHF